MSVASLRRSIGPSSSSSMPSSAGVVLRFFRSGLLVSAASAAARAAFAAAARSIFFVRVAGSFRFDSIRHDLLDILGLSRLAGSSEKTKSSSLSRGTNFSARSRLSSRISSWCSVDRGLAVGGSSPARLRQRWNPRPRACPATDPGPRTTTPVEILAAVPFDSSLRRRNLVPHAESASVRRPWSWSVVRGPPRSLCSGARAGMRRCRRGSRWDVDLRNDPERPRVPARVPVRLGNLNPQ